MYFWYICGEEGDLYVLLLRHLEGPPKTPFIRFRKFDSIPSLQRGFCFFLFFFLKKNIIYLFIYFWLCWVFVSVWGLSPVVASGGHSSSRCTGLSPSWPLLLWSTGSRRAGSVVVAHGPSCSMACGIIPDEGTNPCPLHRQADSQPLRHQGSPVFVFLIKNGCWILSNPFLISW